MSATRIYIAGPMRGYPENNYPAFNAAAYRFRAAGFLVKNPVEIGLEAFGHVVMPGPDYIRLDAKAVCECEAIALLPGWEGSTGARCEVVLAITLGLVFMDALTMDCRPAPERVVIEGGYERAPRLSV